jgi:hypothetical protein
MMTLTGALLQPDASAGVFQIRTSHEPTVLWKNGALSGVGFD